MRGVRHAKKYAFGRVEIQVIGMRNQRLLPISNFFVAHATTVFACSMGFSN